MTRTLSQIDIDNGYRICTVCTNICLHQEVCSVCKQEQQDKAAIQFNGGNTIQTQPITMKPGTWYEIDDPYKMLQEKECSALQQERYTDSLSQL